MARNSSDRLASWIATGKDCRAMLKALSGAVLLLLALAVAAQPPTLPVITYITHDDISGFIKALPDDAVNDKPIRSVDVGGYAWLCTESNARRAWRRMRICT